MGAANTSRVVLFVYYVALANCEPCHRPVNLPLANLKAECSANSYLRNLPCWNALDGLSHTLWQPKHSERSKPIFTVTFSKEVVLSKIELEQYRWSAGYAKLLRLEFGKGQNRVYRFPERDGGWVDRMTLMPTQVRTSHIKFVVEEVSGYLFGGFAELRFFGCAERNRPVDLEEQGAQIQYGDAAYDDYEYDIPGSPPSSSSSSSIFKSRSAIYGTYAGMALGVICGILLLAVIIYALVVNSRKKDEDATSEEASRGNLEDEVLREEEFELREAIRKSVSEIVASSSVNGNPSDAASALHNLDEIEVISEEDIDDLRGEV